MRVNPSEAVFGFASWLTTRDEAVTFGANHDASRPAELADAYCKEQEFEAIRDDKYPDNLKPGPESI